MNFLKNKLKDVGAWPALYVAQHTHTYTEEPTEVIYPVGVCYDFDCGEITVEVDAYDFIYNDPDFIHTVGETIIFENIVALYANVLGYGDAPCSFATQMRVCAKCGELLPDLDYALVEDFPDEYLFDGAMFTDDSLLLEAACVAIRGGFFKTAARLSNCAPKCQHKPPKKVQPLSQKEREFFQLHQATSQLTNLCTLNK
jgi:hypothetical protein